MTLRLIVEIRAGPEGDGFTGRLRYPDNIETAGPLRLGPDDTVRFSDRFAPFAAREVSLADLVRSIVGFKAEDVNRHFHERTWLDIGEYLYRQVFRDESPAKASLRHPTVDLRILSDSEHLRRLPWTLLAYKGSFLGRAGWTVSVGRREPKAAVSIPETPRLLIVAPRPTHLGALRFDTNPDLDTRTEDHLTELVAELLGAGRSVDEPGEQLREARDRQGFVAALREQRPHYVYFYGHGRGNSEQSEFLFEDLSTRAADPIPMIDVAGLIASVKAELAPDADPHSVPPFCVYMNCCRGDSGGAVGASSVFEPALPFVVANRTMIGVPEAREMALFVWNSLLPGGRNAGVDPLSVFRDMFLSPDRDLSLADTAWMTPVLHAGYLDWAAERPVSANPLDDIAGWQDRLDRNEQFGVCVTGAQDLLLPNRASRPLLALLWHSVDPDRSKDTWGLGNFRNRLTCDLLPRLAVPALPPICPVWPRALEQAATPGGLSDTDKQSLSRLFVTMLTECFAAELGSTGFRDIPDAIKERYRQFGKKPGLLFINHKAPPPGILGRQLALYLALWDQVLAPRLAPDLRVLISLPWKMRDDDDLKPRIHHLVSTVIPENYPNTRVRLLDPLGRLEDKHLLEFIDDYGLYAIWDQPEEQHEVARRILKRTEGRYVDTVDAIGRQVDEELRRLPALSTDEPELDLSFLT